MPGFPFLPAALDSFGFYREGVYYEKECSNYELDHQVLLYGYGTSEQGGIQGKGCASEQGKVLAHWAAPATVAAVCLCSDGGHSIVGAFYDVWECVCRATMRPQCTYGITFLKAEIPLRPMLSCCLAGPDRWLRWNR